MRAYFKAKDSTKLRSFLPAPLSNAYGSLHAAELLADGTPGVKGIRKLLVVK
jgi:hypothetical protein